ncbi:hypothetical protein MNEG_12358 [Monoraphidium neglectum]|uniref:Uncharacterized protein n=1 Tax=Monoraphidium neglectum TaxID=145388 RepID=A0A0D2LVR8_9CHLO|nr:hypothetical protein MNEG_12358 [Monoraphidium neglectum]KIY95604.1 hypothetical protein MNEG_12358 [Monoraphidium neglectum]|eukprot:XP_013894624.1 hypothetical protein MNEG_12358 [Monoraphidium neglectum]
MRSLLLALLICGAAQQALAQRPLEAIGAVLHAPSRTNGNSDSIDLGGIAGDIQDIVSSFGKVPKLGQALAAITTAGEQAGASAIAAGLDDVAKGLISRAQEARAFHMGLLGEAGKALSSGAAAFATASAPLRQLSPSVLALDATMTQLGQMTAFLEGLSTYAPPARKAALDGQAARLERIAGNLSSMKEALLGGPAGVIDAIGDAMGALQLPGIFTANDLGTLLDTSINLIGSTLNSIA